MPIFSKIGGTMPSLSSNSAARKCSGNSSGLPCSEASWFARCTASCAFTVNLSQRIAMFTPIHSQSAFGQQGAPPASEVLAGSTTRCSVQNKREVESFSQPPGDFRATAHMVLARIGGSGNPSPLRPDYKLTPSLGSLAARFGFLAVKRLLAADVDLDLLRLSFGFLGQLNLQHALVVVSLNALGVDRVRKREQTGEAAILTLHAAVVLFLLFLLELALAVYGQRVVLDADIDVLLVDSGYFDL